MTKNHLRSAALAILALGAGLSTSDAFARTLYAAPAAGRTDATPTDIAATPTAFVERADGAAAVVPPTISGTYTCAFNEPHTRLERQSCGGTHVRYGY